MAGAGKFNSTVDDDRNTTSLRIDSEDGSVATLQVNGFEIVQIMRVLARARDRMMPEFPTKLGDNFALNESNSFGILRDPGWRVPATPIDGHRVLAVLMPGLGWVVLQFPLDAADQIAKSLTAEGKDPFTEIAGRA